MAPEIEEGLRQLGWFPGRRVADAQVEAWLRIGVQDFGCHIFPEAVRILRDYGDLIHGNIHFTPEGSYARGEKLSWLTWEWQLNEVLFPIGYEMDQYGTFAVSSTGKIYSNYHICHGNSFEEFIASHQNSRVDVTPTHWIGSMDLELERLYKNVYETEE